MPATLVSEPEYPIPAQACKITFTDLHGSTNFVRLRPVSAPLGSKLREAIDAAQGATVAHVHEGDSQRAWDFTPDKGGVFTFSLEEYQIQPASGKTFQDDPSGAPMPEVTQIGNVVLYVGQKMEMTIGQTPDQATLRLYVWDSTVRATTLAVHNEVTPGLFDPTSQLAENAAVNAAVIESVSDLSGETATAIAGTIAADFLVLRGWYSTIHLPGTEHTNEDDINVISSGWTAGNKKAAEEAINQLRSAIDAHTKQLVNSSDNVVHAVIDGETSYFSNGATEDVSTQFFALADACVRLLDHASLDPPHASVTVPGTIAEVGPLTALCMNYITALKSQAPTIPTAKNPGAAVLGQLAGFTEA